MGFFNFKAPTIVNIMPDGVKKQHLFLIFLVDDEEREDPNATISGSSLTCKLNGFLLEFRLSPTLNVSLVAFEFPGGPDQYCYAMKTYIYSIFQGVVGVPVPHPSLDPHMNTSTQSLVRKFRSSPSNLNTNSYTLQFEYKSP